MPEDFIHTTFSKNPFAMFAPQPMGVTFESQEAGEKIILLLRAHVVTLIPPFLVTVLLFLIPAFSPAALSFFDVNLGAFLEPRQTFFMVVFWYLFTFGYSFYQFLRWYFNVYILTNERIVDIDFRGLLHKEAAYAKLNQVQDVSPKTIGFFGTFFHYGDVFIQTAGERQEFEFHMVARPDTVAQEILEQVRIEEGEKPGVIA